MHIKVFGGKSTNMLPNISFINVPVSGEYVLNGPLETNHVRHRLPYTCVRGQCSTDSAIHYLLFFLFYFIICVM